MSFWTKLSGRKLRAKLTSTLLLASILVPTRILLVPGHDAVNSGAEYRGIKEANLNLELGKYLFEFLNSDGYFQVSSARDFTTGDYHDSLAKYFETASTSVKIFRQLAAAKYQQEVASGEIKTIISAPHNFVKDGVAYILHAINKWSNDNRIDLVLHLHFNDHPGHSANFPGNFNGFAIYVPEGQLDNASSSRRIAEQIFTKLKSEVSPSTYPPEKAGIVSDQDLIAIGVNNSRQGASVLMEYGYIYETAIARPETRALYLRELAYQTYLGLRVAFGEKSPVAATTLLPYTFTQNLKFSLKKAMPEVLRLQRALMVEQLYPPAGKNLSACPLSGLFGDCTLAAVTAFQKRYSIPMTGLVGPATRSRLNQLFGQ